jgi:hypothetical protein
MKTKYNLQRTTYKTKRKKKKEKEIIFPKFEQGHKPEKKGREG